MPSYIAILSVPAMDILCAILYRQTDKILIRDHIQYHNKANIGSK